MKAVININGLIGEDTNLLGVIRQFKSFKKPTEVEVIIDSQGGHVDVGMSIYSYLRELNLPITTRANRAYSIAASIFMAGDIRLLEEGSNRFMIHMPWGSVSGGRKQFEDASKQLKDIEEKFTEFYSKYTEVDKESIRRLLENETFLSAQEAKDLGIATGTYQQLKAVAYYKEEENNKEKEDSIMTKAEKFIKAFAQFLEGKEEPKEPEVKALILQDANGEDVSFPDLAENEQPEVGTKVEGEDREILMPDGSKVIVKEGVIESIIPAPEEETEEVEEETETEVSAEEKEEVKAEEKKEDEVDFDAVYAQFEEKILEKVEAKHAKEKEALEATITALKKEVGSEIDNEPTINTKKNSQSGNSLTNALRRRKSNR